MHKVVTDKDGRMRTETPAGGATPEQIAQQRRELRDMLAGNTPFHEDEFENVKPEDKPLPTTAAPGGEGWGICLRREAAERHLAAVKAGAAMLAARGIRFGDLDA